MLLCSMDCVAIVTFQGTLFPKTEQTPWGTMCFLTWVDWAGTSRGQNFTHKGLHPWAHHSLFTCGACIWGLFLKLVSSGYLLACVGFPDRNVCESGGPFGERREEPMLLAGLPPRGHAFTLGFLFTTQGWGVLSLFYRWGHGGSESWLRDVSKFTKAVSRGNWRQIQVCCVLKPVLFLGLLLETIIGWIFTT